jgi:hypothetical protein
MRHTLPIALLLLTAAGLTGCGSDLATNAAQGRYYPEAMPIGPPLPIEVVRVDNEHIRFDNRGVTAFTDVKVWLNRQYGGLVDRIPVGRSKPVALLDFVNHHRERYPIAGFLSPDRSQALIMAGAEIDGQIRKLPVRLEEDWRE